MVTIKGNKKELIKEYKNFCNDLKLIKNYIASIEYFAKNLIENEIKNNGLFNNKYFKTIEIDKVDKEIFTILYKEFINKKYMEV
jgi:hypothetical protein